MDGPLGHQQQAVAPVGGEDEIEPFSQQIVAVTTPGRCIHDVNQKIEERTGSGVEPFLLCDIGVQPFLPIPLPADQLSSEPKERKAEAGNKKRE